MERKSAKSSPIALEGRGGRKKSADQQVNGTQGTGADRTQKTNGYITRSYRKQEVIKNHLDKMTTEVNGDIKSGSSAQLRRQNGE